MVEELPEFEFEESGKAAWEPFIYPERKTG